MPCESYGNDKTGYPAHVIMRKEANTKTFAKHFGPNLLASTEGPPTQTGPWMALVNKEVVLLMKNAIKLASISS